MNRSSLLFGAIAFVSTMAGGLVAARARKEFGLLEAFAAGLLIAVPLFDLLPESVALAGKTGVPIACGDERESAAPSGRKAHIGPPAPFVLAQTFRLHSVRRALLALKALRDARRQQ